MLVTGASGYLAGKLVTELNGIACRIVRMSRRSLPPAPRGKAEIADTKIDAYEPEAWRAAIRNTDIVFHLAAETSVPAAERDPLASFEANVAATMSLLDACRRRGTCPTVVLAGTATEVGVTETTPVDESWPDHPVTVYDTHKLLAEQIVEFHARTGVVRGTTLRLTNVYGPGPAVASGNRGVLNKMMRRALAGEEITVYGDGSPIRDYLFVDDATHAFLAAAAAPDAVNSRHFVIGSGRGHTLGNAFRVVAKYAEKATGRPVPITHVEWPEGVSPIEFRNFVADTAAFRDATGWKPIISLEEGIDQTIASFREQEAASGRGTRTK